MEAVSAGLLSFAAVAPHCIHQLCSWLPDVLPLAHLLAWHDLPPDAVNLGNADFRHQPLAVKHLLEPDHLLRTSRALKVKLPGSGDSG